LQYLALDLSASSRSRMLKRRRPMPNTKIWPSGNVIPVINRKALRLTMMLILYAVTVLWPASPAITVVSAMIRSGVLTVIKVAIPVITLLKANSAAIVSPRVIAVTLFPFTRSRHRTILNNVIVVMMQWHSVIPVTVASQKVICASSHT